MFTSYSASPNKILTEIQPNINIPLTLLTYKLLKIIFKESHMKKITLLFFTVVCLFSLIGVFAENNNNYRGMSPKYIFVFVGDGMSMTQIAATEMFLAAGESKPNQKKLSFSQFEAQGLTTTYDAGSLITDSASAVTALASGNKTLSGVINMDTTKTKKFTTIAELGKSKGYKIGVISSVSINHATPAGFYAKEASRGNYYEIGLQLANSSFDYFGGGGFVHPTGKEKDQKDLYEIVKEKGFKLARTPEEINALKNGDKAVAISSILADGNALNYDMDRSENELSLADFTKKGIDVLNNRKGFMLFVEAGKIDWACHANDGMAAIKDVIAFNESINVAMDFMKKNPRDTLIVVTGDHETGGMSLGFAGTKYSTFFDILKEQKMSYVKFDEIIAEMREENKLSSLNDILPIIKENFGLNTDNPESNLYLTEYEIKQLQEAFDLSKKEETSRPESKEIYLTFGGYEPLSVQVSHILNRKAGIGWTSYSHTAVPVPTYATGRGSDLFDGYYDNTDIFHKLASIIKVN